MHPRSLRQSLIVTAVGLLFSLLLTGFLYYGSQKLSQYGLSKPVYFFALVGLALGAAAFLFKFLDSYAEYSGRVLSGRLKVAGPAVVFLLVVLIGLKYASPERTFAIIIRFESPNGEPLFPRAGKVIVDLQKQRQTIDVAPDGQVHVDEVPYEFAGGSLDVTPQIEDYEAAPSQT